MLTVIIGQDETEKRAFLARTQTYYQERGLAFASHASSRPTVGEWQEWSKIAGAVFVSVEDFSQTECPAHANVIWVSREDGHGPSVLPQLEEIRFRQSFKARIHLPRSLTKSTLAEATLLGLRPASLPVGITALQEHFFSDERFESFVALVKRLGLAFVELRNDLLSLEQAQRITKKLSAEKIFVSIRRQNTDEDNQWMNWLRGEGSKFAVDWDIDLGPPPNETKSLSLYKLQPQESLLQGIARLLSVPTKHHRLAIDIANLPELATGHKFFAADPTKRSFQPRSKSGSSRGRWKWYRHLQLFRMKYSIVHDGGSFDADQPLLLDALLKAPVSERFGALFVSRASDEIQAQDLGDYFSSKDMGFAIIPLEESELNRLTMGILTDMGLRAVSVGALLRQGADRVCDHLDRLSDASGTVNTMYYTENGWQGFVTDKSSLQQILDQVDWNENVAVWGGASARFALHEILPGARFFSVRKGEEIWADEKKLALNNSPEIVIWALDRDREEKSKPPSDWRPLWVIDLNDQASGAAQSFAQTTGARYISGRAYTRAQYLSQTKIWNAAIEARP